MKTAIITGITGQDGSYLAEFLLNKDYFVVGLKRRTSTICTDRINSFYDHKNFKLRYYNLNDSGCFYRLLLEYKPQEVYNLAAQSHVKVSFETPEETLHSGIEDAKNVARVALELMNNGFELNQAMIHNTD